MPKSKTCRYCHEEYTPVRAIQPTCLSFECQLAHAQKIAEQAKANREKAQKAAVKITREKLKTLSDWRREAQTAVNAYVRARDADKPCISCGRHHQGQWHAGHLLSRGAHPELALDPRNIHKQCQPCNTHLSGNQINYRKGLIERYGIELVEWLEGPHEPKKYTIEDLRAIRDEYRRKVREINVEENGG